LAEGKIAPGVVISPHETKWILLEEYKNIGNEN